MLTLTIPTRTNSESSVEIDEEPSPARVSAVCGVDSPVTTKTCGGMDPKTPVTVHVCGPGS